MNQKGQHPMTTTDPDKRAILLDLATSFRELPPRLTVEDGDPAVNAALLDGYTRACAVAISPTAPWLNSAYMAAILDCFTGLVYALNEQSDFENCPVDYMARHDLPTRDSDCDVMSYTLESDVDGWLDRLAACTPIATATAS